MAHSNIWVFPSVLFFPYNLDVIILSNTPPRLGIRSQISWTIPFGIFVHLMNSRTDFCFFFFHLTWFFLGILRSLWPCRKSDSKERARELNPGLWISKKILNAAAHPYTALLTSKMNFWEPGYVQFLPNN